MMPKFRTMIVGTPELGTDEIISPQKYITKIGFFFRYTSLDEIPQILSVLSGDMSFVGPRPALYNEHELISKRKKLGIDILKPGITGWAQINGRDKISLSKKIYFDFEYLKKQSFMFDLIIILRTIKLVFTSKNIMH
jgi:O-antigen biosynthesis protein WbqP